MPPRDRSDRLRGSPAAAAAATGTPSRAAPSNTAAPTPLRGSIKDHYIDVNALAPFTGQLIIPPDGQSKGSTVRFLAGSRFFNSEHGNALVAFPKPLLEEDNGKVVGGVDYNASSAAYDVDKVLKVYPTERFPAIPPLLPTYDLNMPISSPAETAAGPHAIDPHRPWRAVQAAARAIERSSAAAAAAAAAAAPRSELVSDVIASTNDDDAANDGDGSSARAAAVPLRCGVRVPKQSIVPVAFNRMSGMLEWNSTLALYINIEEVSSTYESQYDNVFVVDKANNANADAADATAGAAGVSLHVSASGNSAGSNVYLSFFAQPSHNRTSTMIKRILTLERDTILVPSEDGTGSLVTAPLEGALGGMLSRVKQTEAAAKLWVEAKERADRVKAKRAKRAKAKARVKANRVKKQQQKEQQQRQRQQSSSGLVSEVADLNSYDGNDANDDSDNVDVYGDDDNTGDDVSEHSEDYDDDGDDHVELLDSIVLFCRLTNGYYRYYGRLRLLAVAGLYPEAPMGDKGRVRLAFQLIDVDALGPLWEEVARLPAERKPRGLCEFNINNNNE